VTGLSWFPARCGQTPPRGRGQDSTAGRPAQRARSWRRLRVAHDVHAGNRVVGGRFLQCPSWTVRQNRGSGCPTSLRHRHGWHPVLRPRPGGVNQETPTTPQW